MYVDNRCIFLHTYITYTSQRFVYLFRQELLTQGIECDEFTSQQPSIQEALGHQHDLTNQLKVRHNHSTWSVTQKQNYIHLLFVCLFNIIKAVFISILPVPCKVQCSNHILNKIEITTNLVQNSKVLQIQRHFFIFRK